MRVIDYSYIAIAVLFMLNQMFHLMQTRQWARERKDLYDRIMSKDLKEYKENTPGKPVTYDPIDNTEEAEWEREQQALKK